MGEDATKGGPAFPDAKRRRKQDATRAAYNSRIIKAKNRSDVAEMLQAYWEWVADESVPLKDATVGLILAGIEQQGVATIKAQWEQVQRVFASITGPRIGLTAPRENHFTLMIRLCCNIDSTADAFTYYKAMRASLETCRDEPQPRHGPRIRTFHPILTSCARVGDYATAAQLFQEEVLPMKGGAIMTEMEQVNWQDCCLDYATAVANSELANPEKKQRVDDILHILYSSVGKMKVFGKANANDVTYHREAKASVLGILAKAGYTTQHETVAVSMTGLCAETQLQLAPRTLSLEHVAELRDLTERLCLESANDVQKAEWGEFREWLAKKVQAKEYFNGIIDAANVGHTAQNNQAGYFSHQQIDAVASACDKPLIVVREHWLKPTTNLRIRKNKYKKAKLPQLAIGDTASAAGAAEAGADADSVMAAQLREQLGLGPESEEQQEAEAEEEEEEEEESPSGEADGAPAEKTVGEQYREKWEKEGVLLIAPHRVCDDWVAMYVACVMILEGVPDVQLVTNDIFRDHYWRMHHHPALPVWRERNLTKFSLRRSTNDEEKEAFRPTVANDSELPPHRIAALHPPARHSEYGQQDEQRTVWHIPFDTAPVTWAAAKYTDANSQ